MIEDCPIIKVQNINQSEKAYFIHSFCHYPLTAVYNLFFYGKFHCIKTINVIK